MSGALAPIRYSRLSLMGKSPAHCRYALDQDLASIDNWDDTPSRRMGRLAHAVFLGQPLPLVFPGESRRGKAWLEFKAAHEGEDIVKQDELDTAKAMAEALMRHDEARELLSGQYVERTFTATFSGRLVRATPDVFQPRRHLTELKSTTDASPGRFAWQATKLGYQGQMAMQLDVLLAQSDETGGGTWKAPRPGIVAAETKPPYVVNVFAVTDEAIDYGRRLWRGWLEQFLVCESSNEWPGYVPGVLGAPEEGISLVGADGELIEVD